MEAPSPSRRARRAATLAYPLGIVSGIVSLLAFGDEAFARFHAWQSILLTGFSGLAIAGLGRVPLVGDALGLGVGVATAIALLWLASRAWRGQWTLLPLIGDVAAERAR